MKSLIAKRVISILVNLRYLRLKLLKYKENNKKIHDTFYHNFKNIPVYIYIYNELGIIRKALFHLTRWCYYYFFISKMARNPFCDESVHMYTV